MVGFRISFKRSPNESLPRSLSECLCRSLYNYGRIAAVRSPVTEVKDVPTEPLAPRSLSAEAINVLLRAARAEQNAILRARDEALLALLISTGLRVQEACDLQLRDLELGGESSRSGAARQGKHAAFRCILTPCEEDLRSALGRAGL